MPHSNRYAFFHGAIVPIEQAKVSVMTHALHYGTGCFGGLRAYWNEVEQELFLFRVEDHYRRFVDSTRLLHMKIGMTVEELASITKELLRREGYREDAYIRPLAYKWAEMIGVRLHDVAR